jgi:hypothetical protein
VGTLVDRILFFTYCSIVIFCTMAIFKNWVIRSINYKPLFFWFRKVP